MKENFRVVFLTSQELKEETMEDAKLNTETHSEFSKKLLFVKQEICNDGILTCLKRKPDS